MQILKNEFYCHKVVNTSKCYCHSRTLDSTDSNRFLQHEKLEIIGEHFYSFISHTLRFTFEMAFDKLARAHMFM